MGLQLIHGSLGNQNFLEPNIDWGIVVSHQSFLQSDIARHARYYVEY
jgi:hypothetical protein